MTRLKSLLFRETRKILLIAPIVAVLAAGGARLGTVLTAQEPVADQNSKQREKNLAAGEREAKQLLLLMDRDQSGKVSKQEFMRFMEAEFERMDINKDGELDVKELTGFRLVPHGGSPHR
ncbi:MAG: EF-hand domain-containing protein [Bryobacteraceae bacterium]|jgi:hypothetical protein